MDPHNNQRGSWKHSIEDPVKYVKTEPTIIIHKNPYTWVESISLRNNVDWKTTQQKYPAHAKTSDELYIGESRMNITNLMMTYKEFHDNWLYREDIPSYVVIKYEDLLVPELRVGILDNIRKTFGWQAMHKDWVVTKPGSVSQSKDYNEDRERYYISGIPKTLTRDQIHEINRVMEIWPIHRMGYTIL